jgi:DNA repair exonuclease SbcCD nuclease subunit
MIITADIHARKQKPRCRLDPDWVETQRTNLQEIVEIANKKLSPLKIVGDIFHTARQSHEIVNMVIEELRHVDGGTYVFEGNHDEQYSPELRDKTAYGTIEKYFPNCNIRKPDNVLYLHELVFPDDKSRPVKEAGITAEELLDKYPDKKWIFTGDYHHNFHFEKDGRHVVNPGCINRQNSGMKDYQPGVYYVDMEKEVVEFIELKSDTGEMVTDEYIQEQNDRDERIDSFIELVKKRGQISLDFISNVQEKLKSPDVDSEVKDLILEIIQEVE